MLHVLTGYVSIQQRKSPQTVLKISFMKPTTKVSTVENAAVAFRLTGIKPFYRNILPESDQYLKNPRHENACESQDKQITMPNVPVNPNECITTTVVSPVTHSRISPSEEISDTSGIDFCSQSTSLSFNKFFLVHKTPAKVSESKGEVPKILTSSRYKETLSEKINKQ